MKTYTYSEARQQFASLLDRARREGRVQIRRRDGQVFVLSPTKSERSPLDVPGVQVRLPRGEMMKWVRGEREGSAERFLNRNPSDARASRTRTNAIPRRRKSAS
jgi:antitoxin (DNA-binding transcriptional repressor) of toxin-antitoxin stability system